MDEHAERLGAKLLAHYAGGTLTHAVCREAVKVSAQQAKEDRENEAPTRELEKVPYGIKLVNHRGPWGIANEIRRLVVKAGASQWFEDGDGI